MTKSTAECCDTMALTALASGDLPAHCHMSAEAHLRDCPRCQAELAQIAEVWAAAKNGAGPVNADAVRAELHLRLPIPERKRTMFDLITPGRIALGGLTGLAAGAALWLIPGTPVRPLPAFADVERAMQAIQTATWTESSFYGDTKPSRNKNASAYYYTMQRQPEPLIVYRTASLSGGNSRGSTTVTNRSGQFSPPDNKGRVSDYLIWSRGENVNDAIAEKLFFPTTEQDRRRTVAARTRDAAYGYQWTRSPWKRDTARLQGQSVLCFTNHEERRRNDSNWWRKQPPSTIDNTIYVDPQTYRIVRAETRHGGSFAHSTIVRASFRYNVPVREDIAAVLPPVGKTVAIVDFDLVGPTAPHVPVSEAAEVKSLLAQSASAWASPRFADVLDAGFPAEADRRWVFLREAQQRNQRLRAVAADWNKAKLWRSFRIGRVIEVHYLSNYPYTREGETAPFPPPPSRGMYEAIAVVEGVTKQGKTISCPARFYVRRDGELRLTTTAFYPNKPATEADGWTSEALQKRINADVEDMFRGKTGKSGKARTTRRKKALHSQDDGLVG